MVHDVFICHAREDKATVGIPLHDELVTRGLTAWLDKYQLQLGDSVRKKIDEGLLESRFGVVILSPSFFGKGWTEWELDGLVARQLSEGRKVILPVWHEVDYEEVARHSPSLANVWAARTSDGIESVADAIADVLGVPPVEIVRVPRNAEEEIALLRTKPDAWEYLLFAAILRREMDALESKYRDHELGYAAPGGEVLRGDDARSFLTNAFASSRALTSNITRLFDPEPHERAFGALGESGDPERIEHLARRIIDVYAGLLDWGARVRSTVLPNDYEQAKELAADFVTGPIEQFRAWVDDVVSQTDEVPARLARGEEELSLVFKLVLSVDDGVVDEFNEAVDDISRWV